MVVLKVAIFYAVQVGIADKVSIDLLSHHTTVSSEPKFISENVLGNNLLSEARICLV